jgi:hypothetical protein
MAVTAGGISSILNKQSFYVNLLSMEFGADTILDLGYNAKSRKSSLSVGIFENRSIVSHRPRSLPIIGTNFYTHTVKKAFMDHSLVVAVLTSAVDCSLLFGSI